jgi:hypothetical protein
MAWRIIQLFISIFIIIGGLSGEYVLRGTESSGALVIFGIGWLIYDIYQIATYNKTPKNNLLELQVKKAQEKSRALTEPAEIVIKNANTDQEQYVFFFNNSEYIGGAAPGNKITITTNQSVNAIGASYERYDPISAAVTVEISENEKKQVSFCNNSFTVKEETASLTANS